MNQKLKTTLEFTKNLFITGALTETSHDAEIEICKHIPEDKDVVIAEFGMGHGNITKIILDKISPNSKLYAFEVKEEFCEYVEENINDDRLEVINDGAENLKKHVNQKIDGIIGSIPFTFFTKEKAYGILEDAYNSLTDKSFYSQALYVKSNFKKFESIFDNCDMVKLPNIPTEYVFHCQKNVG